MILLELVFSTQRSSTQVQNRGRPPHATEKPKNSEIFKPPCPFGDLVSCMDACTDDPDFSSTCTGICKERCPTNIGYFFR